jgi:hypothetical protein
MSDSFVEKLTLIVATVLRARAYEFDFPRRPATRWLQDVASREIVRAILKRKGFDYNKEAL